ncbi:hypothetical protein Q9L58_005340 [Maublancomyces gigas]|uniref:PNPLA domain-containing protein n=1 Tax=Discina gigas TaxID=1032678 RepID=A0ABR3GIF6_9PEZI
MTSHSSRNSTGGGYHYDPETGTHIPTHRRPSHPPPPPLPPKELEGAYITKETQHEFAELEGDPDIGALSIDEKPSSSSSATPRKSKRPVPRQKRKLRILSLDGGGIRGYSTLVILGELMHQIFLLNNTGKGPAAPSEIPRPCDYFDLIGGTGTGGLIALMLGRMRMDIESCKEYYVELTRYVFITDKTLMGVPYGKTLFKASRLEEAIRHCVRESTRFESKQIIPHSPPPKPDDQKRIEPRRSGSWRNAMGPIRRRASSLDREEVRGRRGQRRGGNAEAPLLDPREGACKTFVTAVYKGTPPNASNPPVLLRTYPSRAESVPSYNCTIWQAGRATSATLSAFKPITIGQNTFLDEGSGRYNPAQQVLEEAHISEYPNDDIGVFISVGTGKRPDNPPGSPGRPSSSHHGHGHGHGHIHGHSHSHSTGDRPMWWEGIISTPFEDFTEARRRLMAKLDDCERVHRALIDPEDGGRPGLAKMGVAREDYYRFNVEVGVGEFALNEWNRLPEVSTNTRRYIAQRETGKLLRECASKMVVIEQQNNSTPSTAPPLTAPPQTARRQSSPGIVRPSPPRIPEGVAELSAEIQAAAADWGHPIGSPTEKHPAQRPYSAFEPTRERVTLTGRPFSPIGQTHPSQRPFSPIEQIVAYPLEPQEQLEMPDTPPVPPKPPKPVKESRPLYSELGYDDNPHFAGGPNPEIRLTSPTTVAGDSDDEGRRIGTGRRRRSRSGSHGGGKGGRRR